MFCLTATWRHRRLICGRGQHVLERFRDRPGRYFRRPDWTECTVRPSPRSSVLSSRRGGSVNSNHVACCRDRLWVTNRFLPRIAESCRRLPNSCNCWSIPSVITQSTLEHAVVYAPGKSDSHQWQIQRGRGRWGDHPPPYWPRNFFTVSRLFPYKTRGSGRCRVRKGGQLTP